MHKIWMLNTANWLSRDQLPKEENTTLFSFLVGICYVVEILRKRERSWVCNHLHEENKPSGDQGESGKVGSNLVGMHGFFEDKKVKPIPVTRWVTQGAEVQKNHLHDQRTCGKPEGWEPSSSRTETQFRAKMLAWYPISFSSCYDRMPGRSSLRKGGVFFLLVWRDTVNQGWGETMWQSWLSVSDWVECDSQWIRLTTW